MEAKVIAKPVGLSQYADKSRNVSGLGEWARSSRFVGFIMMFLGWLCLPFEVILRKDFGERWFTAINFYVGLLVLILISWLHVFWVGAGVYLYQAFSWLGRYNPFHLSFKSIFEMQVTTFVVTTIYALYFYMGLYHRFKIRWRNQVGIPLHSFDDGTSRLLWLAKMFKETLNIVGVPLMAICWLLLPRKQRSGKPFPKLITNTHALAYTLVEPLVVFELAWYVTGVISLWLYLSSFALLVTAQFRELARKDKILDFQDGKIEAEMARERRIQQLEEAKKISAKKTDAKKPEKTKQIPAPVTIKHPPLHEIIEKMQTEKYPVNIPTVRHSAPMPAIHREIENITDTETEPSETFIRIEQTAIQDDAPTGTSVPHPAIAAEHAAKILSILTALSERANASGKQAASEYQQQKTVKPPNSQSQDKSSSVFLGYLFPWYNRY